MSRLIKKPISVPAGVVVAKEEGALIVRGAKGERRLTILPLIEVGVGAEAITVALLGSSKQSRANSGTMWSLIVNAIEGVTKGFSKKLEIEGVGYRANMEGSTLILSLGYVEPVRFPLPEGVTVTTEKGGITISGIDKELVGRVAARIRALKKPEPYKGKGIRYEGEVVRRKVGKKAVASSA